MKKPLLPALWILLGLLLPARENFASPSNARRAQKEAATASDVALQTQKTEIPATDQTPAANITVPATKTKDSDLKKKNPPASSPEANEPLSLNGGQLRQILFESSSSQILIKIEGSGGLSKVKEEKMVNPGRLTLEISGIQNAVNVNIGEFTDREVVPRIRLAQHPDRLRIIVDTVLKNFPAYRLQKSDREITLTLEKTPEMVQEARSRKDLFAAMQQNDREALLKLGSEDEGGILFEAGIPGGPGKVQTAGGIRMEQGPAQGNRVVFLLDDRREYKIFIQDTETPIHIQKIRPGYEVKGIQARLNQLGYSTGLEDGSVGSQTREALKQFQKDRGIPVTGIPNKRTQRELRKEFGY